MKAIAIIPGTTTVKFVDRPEPSITAPDEIKLRVLWSGSSVAPIARKRPEGRADASPGAQEMETGHAMFGQVVTVAKAGSHVRFTFFWSQASHWEGREFAVRLNGEHTGR